MHLLHNQAQHKWELKSEIFKTSDAMEQSQNNIKYSAEPALSINRTANRSMGFAASRDIVIPRSTAPVYTPDLTFKSKFFLAELLGMLFVVMSTVYIFAMPAAFSKPGALKAMINQIIKRTVDILGSVVGLILCLPILLILPILIKLDSRGPVFYTQLRIGVNRRKADRRYHQKSGIDCQRNRDRRREDLMGKPFNVIKFRTMVDSAEKLSGPVWATKNDPRITRLGRFMRRSRLDEIPQFINVLKGDMSLVGPRPERPAFVKDLSQQVDGYTQRLQVKPGLTGLAQVEQGYDSSIASVAEKVRYDVSYIRTMSLWSDIKILAKTVVVVFTGRGAC